MATIPTIPTEAPGNFWTSALWNANILGGLNYLFAPVRFKGYSSVTQAIGTGTTAVPLTMDTEIIDSDGGHSTVANTSRYVCQTAGTFYINGSVCFATSASGTRTLMILVNGVVVPGSMIQTAPQGSNGGSACTATTTQLSVGDYVEIACWQNSGGTLATSIGGSQSVNSTMNLFRFSA
ncbi:hypothetical protein [Streptomyces sp. NPDC050738]|uniref:hypothetical protein n=1 Tax=Streptomyces sp. NPDC050738 TaxID=3154744 RepID=UPI0034477915